MVHSPGVDLWNPWEDHLGGHCPRPWASAHWMGHPWHSQRYHGAVVCTATGGQKCD